MYTTEGKKGGRIEKNTEQKGYKEALLFLRKLP
jgi:hypothetical protein